MIKYNVVIHTKSPDFTPECRMDEEMVDNLHDRLCDPGQNFLQIEDDTSNKMFILNISEIIGIECEEVI